MATDASFAEYVLDLASGIPAVRVRKMFGEYALFIGDKTVALICDNQVFVKPTDAGREVLGTVALAPPYSGAKDSFLIDEALDDRELFTRLLRATEAALPQPKPKKPKMPRGGSSHGSTAR